MFNVGYKHKGKFHLVYANITSPRYAASLAEAHRRYSGGDWCVEDFEFDYNEDTVLGILETLHDGAGH